MGLFSKKAPSPDESCPRCGGPKPASLPVCTTCKFKDDADRSPMGFPGSEKDKMARQQGQRWTPPPPGGSGAPPATPYPLSAPPRGTTGGGPAPYAAAGDPYALNTVNYPLRAKSGLPVRNAAEVAVADYFFERGVALAYEPLVANHRPTFLYPAKTVVIEVRADPSPLPEWQRAERLAAYRAYGFSAVEVDGRRGNARAEIERLVPV